MIDRSQKKQKFSWELRAEKNVRSLLSRRYEQLAFENYLFINNLKPIFGCTSRVTFNTAVHNSLLLLKVSSLSNYHLDPFKRNSILFNVRHKVTNNFDGTGKFSFGIMGDVLEKISKSVFFSFKKHSFKVFHVWSFSLRTISLWLLDYSKYSNFIL